MAEVNIRLESGDWFYITGRGAVATIAPSEWPFYPGELVNQEVEIDRKKFIVFGVESWADNWYPGKQEAIGLLVRPIDATISNGRFPRSKPNTYESIVAKHESA